ncbi:type II/IV secretion system ATPase subunit [Halodesulfurarchaeum sp. HSR-GB]|uniref:type II/IV secretion system ATPase subunit n=1 Tax=Halodesulfurarchaeum sp. HSR-GB TaxID=3074077 RepID=UPI0028613519|nr:type II/IV secretion system ATPase subunit [Halodesulfurarchaeum sp. HSR-GB]MDR5657017.1 type II/IV secretion system ATPase subunit [Halodesulfurarchaeum sp. HSR-GB]
MGTEEGGGEDGATNPSVDPDGGARAPDQAETSTADRTDMERDDNGDFSGPADLREAIQRGVTVAARLDETVTRARLGQAATDADNLDTAVTNLIEGTVPVRKGVYSWLHFKWEYYLDEVGDPPRDDDGTPEPFDKAAYLGFEPGDIESTLSYGESRADALADLIEERTVNVQPDLDEDAFFSTVSGATTLTNRYDLERAVPMAKKTHFVEEERYWVNKPYAFVVIFHSRKENEKKYYLIEPYRTPIEADLREFLTEKLRTAIKYAEEGVTIGGSDAERRAVIERETDRLLNRYDLYDTAPDRGFRETIADGLDFGDRDGFLGRFTGDTGAVGQLRNWLAPEAGPEADSNPEALSGIAARPEPALLAEDDPELNEYQVEKLRYFLARDFTGYERIDGIKHDINVEDISCDGYESPVFVYHTDYEQLISNVTHGTEQLDDFVVKLAQRSGKGISKRQPQVDATLPDGSRAQLTLGTEVSDHGTNYTIRQFKDVPFTPVDLINWKTFSLEEMAFLWLCIENNKSLLFAGGTASGKTTSLNAVSLFVPSNAKIVSIEDTREVELPQRNWIASVTRPSFGEDEAGDIDEFDLLEAALRQRPDYIIMGEVRGEEGRTLFQVMSTGHTTYTTFHADNVSEVIKRFTTEPINVSKTLFTALDLVSIQASTRVRGKKVRRSRNITEIRRYDAENDEINVNDVFQWRPETDTYRSTAESTTLDEIKFDRGWSEAELQQQLFERRVVLASLIEQGLNTYSEVAATLQAYINDPETLLTLIANDELEEALGDLRELESVLIDVDPELEAMVPRPEPDADILETTTEILDRAEEELFPEYRGERGAELVDILPDQDDSKAPSETDRPGADEPDHSEDSTA